MAQPISAEAIKKGSGKSWEEWLLFFEEIGAEKLAHKEIAQKVHEQGGAPGWWAQMVTVKYEQHIGRRTEGQDNTGKFAVSVSKTIDGSMDEALALWQKTVKEQSEFSNVRITEAPNVSKTLKWRHWRCGLANGTRVIVSAYQKGAGKAPLTVTHEKLESAEQVEQWREYWKTFLNSIS